MARQLSGMTGYFTWLAALASLACAASSVVRAQGAPAHDTVVFVNVNVIPMDSERVLIQRGLVVADGRIAWIGSADSVPSFPHATRIDGANRLFILPGLVDMHSHIRYESDLTLLVANGVVVTRNMRGTPMHLDLRARVARGAFLGPRIITAGPVFYGGPHSGATPENARALVDSEAAAGYDFIKVYDGLPAASYAVVVAEAARHGLPVAGHVPGQVGVEGALRAHQRSIEHAEEIVYHYFGANLDDARIPIIAREIRDAGTYVTPTLSYMRPLELQWDDPRAVLSRPEVGLLDPETYAFWRTDPGHNSAVNHVLEPFLRKLVRGLRDNGVKLLAGTDFYIFGNVAGYSLHRELAALVDAGLTPYEALTAATRTPAQYFGEDSVWGTVSIGKRANLLVLDANPLDDIRNTAMSHREGVMLNGRWLTRAELDRRVDSLAHAFAAGQRLVDSLLAPGAAHYVATHHDRLPVVQLSTISQVAEFLTTRKRWEDAIAVGGELTRQFPDSAEAFEDYGDALAGAQRTGDALRAYRRALALDPSRNAVAKKIAAIDSARPGLH